MKQKILNYILPLIAFCMYITPAMADLDNPDDSEDPPYDAAPIDNWMMLLLFVGIVIGVYAMFKYKKKHAV